VADEEARAVVIFKDADDTVNIPSNDRHNMYWPHHKGVPQSGAADQTSTHQDTEQHTSQPADGTHHGAADSEQDTEEEEQPKPVPNMAEHLKGHMHKMHKIGRANEDTVYYSASAGYFKLV